MPVITIITDWNNNDFYLGVLKGKILSLFPEVNIIDITHQIPAFAYIQAAYIVKNSFPSFPSGTVHIVAVNSEASPDNPHLAIEHDGQYFIGADNGIFGLVFRELEYKAFKLNTPGQSTFPNSICLLNLQYFLPKAEILKN